MQPTITSHPALTTPQQTAPAPDHTKPDPGILAGKDAQPRTLNELRRDGQRGRTQFLRHVDASQGGLKQAQDLFREAVFGGKTDKARALLASQGSAIDVNQPINAHGARPLTRAIAKGDVDMTGLLLKHGADPSLGKPGANGETVSLMHNAISAGHPRIARLLLEDGRVLQGEKENTAFLTGVVGRLAELRGQLKSATPEEADKLHEAIRNTQEIGDMLRQKGAKITGLTLHATVLKGDKESFVEVLTAQRAAVSAGLPNADALNQQRHGTVTELMKRDSSWLKLYLDQGMDPFIENRSGQGLPTPVHYAVQEGKLEHVGAILDRFGPEKFNDVVDGYSMAQRAVFGGHQDMLELLMDKGVSPYVGVDGGALSMAGFFGHKQMFGMLLDRGIDYNETLPGKDVSTLQLARITKTQIEAALKEGKGFVPHVSVEQSRVFNDNLIYAIGEMERRDSLAAQKARAEI